MAAEYRSRTGALASANDSALTDAIAGQRRIGTSTFPTHNFRIMIRADPAARSCKDWQGALRRAIYKEVP
jgi:hypothetical protein